MLAIAVTNEYNQQNVQEKNAREQETSHQSNASTVNHEDATDGTGLDPATWREFHYIRALIFNAELRIVVTMHEKLAHTIHDMHYLALDFTFKRVKSGLEIHSWEVVGMNGRTNRRKNLFAYQVCSNNPRYGPHNYLFKLAHT
jgi:hypothetical protein